MGDREGVFVVGVIEGVDVPLDTGAAATVRVAITLTG